MEEQRRILIADDEKMLLDALVEKFEHEGFVTYSASDGKEALQLALDHHPDILLLDIIMPEMDGMKVLEKIREDEWGKNVPVIMLTNLGPDDEVTDQVTRDEPAYYLVKANTEIDEIVEKVNQLLVKEKTNIDNSSKEN